MIWAEIIYLAIAAGVAWMLWDEGDEATLANAAGHFICGMFWPLLLLMAALDGF